MERYSGEQHCAMRKLERSILEKRGVRSDALWTQPRIYNSWLKHIPLFLDTWALMRSQYWLREDIRALQSRRLRELLRDAATIPFWNRQLQGLTADIAEDPIAVLRTLPIFSKKDFAGKPLEEVARPDLMPRSNTDHTSGSTGIPFHFHHDWGASLRSSAVTERIFRTATGKRYPIVYMRARERYGFTFYRHVWFFLRGFNSIQHRLDDLKRLGEKLKHGFILYGYTSWVVELARLMEHAGMRLPLRAVMVAGEHLLPQDKALIERVMDAELFTFYASREVGFLGYECEHRNMHVSEEWALLEVVDADGKLVPPGAEGRIVVTMFENRVMPFIRYDIGDIGSLSEEPCPCGRTLKTLSFKGRTVELIQLDDNRVVSLLDIAYALGTYRDSVRQYQIVQNGPMSFVFKVVVGPTFAANQEYLESLMVRMIHPRVRITWEIVESVPASTSGKAAYFVRDFTYRA